MDFNYENDIYIYKKGTHFTPYERKINGLLGEVIKPDMPDSKLQSYPYNIRLLLREATDKIGRVRSKSGWYAVYRLCKKIENGELDMTMPELKKIIRCNITMKEFIKEINRNKPEDASPIYQPTTQTFKNYKRDTIQAAIDLEYNDNVIAELYTAITADELTNIMRKARKEKLYA